MNAVTRVQRPRLARNSDGGLDEKTATFFVDKAIRAIAEDVAQDRGPDGMISGPRPSLGNLKGQQRFVNRMEKLAKGAATLRLSTASEGKRFSFVWDCLRVENGRLAVERLSMFFKRHSDATIRSFDTLTISRHALIRSIQRVQIKSVEDVFRFLVAIWGGLWWPLLIMNGLKLTTPGKTCWLIPVPFGEDRMLGLLIARPTTDDAPALVTVYPDGWIPDALLPVGQELMRVVSADDMAREERDAAVTNLLTQLLV